MTYKEFLETLEELQLDLDSASEALELEISDIEAWEDEDEVPASAEKWIKKEKVEFVALNNTNEDENFEDEEKDLIESESLDFEEDDNLDEEEK
jgi:hypothetical protein